MEPEGTGPAIVLLTLAALLISCLIVDSVLRPPETSTTAAAVTAAAHLNTSTAAAMSNPCHASTPCTHVVHDTVHDACLTVQAAPGTACTSPCLVGPGTCAPVGNCQGVPRGRCTSAADCSWSMNPGAPNETEVLCVQGQCQLHVRGPYVMLEDHALVLVGASCSTYLAMDQTCIRQTSVLVPMDMTRHKEPNTQYRVCQFVFT